MDKYGDVVINFADPVFGFWEDVQSSSEKSPNFGDSQDVNIEDDNFDAVEENNKAFWEEQEQILKVLLLIQLHKFWQNFVYSLISYNISINFFAFRIKYLYLK